MPLATSPAAPTLDDARRAAEAVAGAGASQVLLFGSLARGGQAPGSDIDLVAIFDDLDYPTRWARKSELQRLAGEAAGCDVDVRVTDWPEWAVRSKVVTTSFESRIARDAVVLWSGEPRGVNWDKEIGLPTTNEEEAAASLTNTCEALAIISGQLHPHPDEQSALDERDPEEYVALLATRMRSVCSHAQAAMENSLKAMIHRRGAEPPPRTHQLAILIDGLSPGDRAAAEACLGDLALPDVSLWRQQGTYPGDFPETPVEGLVPLAYRMATAGARLGQHTADSIAPASEPATSDGSPAAGGIARSPTAAAAADRARRYAGRILDILDRWDPAAPTPTAIMGRPPPPEPPASPPGLP
ncbi:MAG: HEPN domain-containing protein [bacterium]|nr:HEPN domain-containing protein [bacterium]